MRTEQFFAKTPVFTLQEFISFCKINRNIGVSSIIQLLRYHERAGNILHVRRGLFAYIPIASKNKNYQANPYLIAGRVTTDSVIAYHTALELQGFAYSVFHEFYFITDKILRPFQFQGIRYHPLKKLSDYGIITINRDGLDIRTTIIERTLVDLLHKTKYSGGFNEIWQSFDLVSSLDVDKIIEYTLILDNSSTIAKVGFFLEKQQEKFAVSEKHLSLLESRKPKHKLYLERSKRKHGKLINRWNLIVPHNLLTNQLEDPNEIF